ncbi:MAG: non-heme iron oxygenase ferredoxin subunit [Thermaerobacter sp.]|nr:non-heme iron oxygenase ferredoxin subunit [Thermaerobacter sp.]
MEYFAVALEQEITEGRGTLREVAGERLAFFRVGDEIYCIDDTCSHAMASLSAGSVDGRIVTCPLHGGQFDIPTGKPVRLPVTAPVAVHPVEIRDGQVFVGLEDDEDEDY